MKAFSVEILIIDHDDVGFSGIRDMIENTHYPNHAIAPMVMSSSMKDIGEWTDEHPLNKRDTLLATYNELFGRKK